MNWMTSSKKRLLAKNNISGRKRGNPPSQSSNREDDAKSSHVSKMSRAYVSPDKLVKSPAVTADQSGGSKRGSTDLLMLLPVTVDPIPTDLNTLKQIPDHRRERDEGDREDDCKSSKYNPPPHIAHPIEALVKSCAAIEGENKDIVWGAPKQEKEKEKQEEEKNIDTQQISFFNDGEPCCEENGNSLSTGRVNQDHDMWEKGLFGGAIMKNFNK